MVNVQEVQKSSIIATPDVNTFSFLDLTGRQKYYKEGYRGQDIIVAVMDTGVNPDHPELKGKVLEGKNFCKMYYDSYGPIDDDGHGTHVAATIAGNTCGVAPSTLILPCKVLPGFGGGSIEELIEALYWVRNWRDKNGNKVDIVSMSLSCGDSEFTDRLHDAIKSLVDNNIAVICAAGNTGDNTKLYPAYFNEPITVGAVNINQQTAYFSTRTDEVDVCQVGVDVVSAWYEGGYIAMSGTSMATPIVTGIAALIASKYKTLFRKQIPEQVLYEMLKLNTIDLSFPGIDMETGAGFCTLGSGKAVEMYIGQTDYYINQIKNVMDVAPAIVNDRTMVPVRFVAEAFNKGVYWDATERKVTIID